jgi:hypothetical protein
VIVLVPDGSGMGGGGRLVKLDIAARVDADGTKADARAAIAGEAFRAA